MFNKWINHPESFKETTDTIQITAAKQTDIFVSPFDDNKSDNIALYAFEENGDFTLSSKVTPHFASTYDAGSIMLYISDTNWVKFAFEYTDIGHNAAVCVVTDEYSDDSNGEVVTQDFVWMKMSRKGNVIGVYFSLDAVNWRMVRMFRHNIKDSDKVYIGLSAQSPIGEGCKVDFEDINFSQSSVLDFRKGE